MTESGSASDWLFRNVFVALAAAVAMVTLVTLFVSRPREGDAKNSATLRPRRVLLSVFGALTVTALLVLRFAGDSGWVWLLAFLPTAMVLFQGLCLGIFKNSQFFSDSQELPKAPEAQKFLEPLMKAAWNEERRYYSSASLLLRFGLPALLLGAVALSAALCLLDPGFCEEQLQSLGDSRRRELLVGARLGLAGAYIYVVMYLGNRGFRGDITPGAAIWSAVTLAVGPIFATVLVYIADPEVGDQWSAELVPFAAGFSLRYMAKVVEGAIRRLFGSAADNTSRSAPLSQVRGISKDVEERLAEEGIENVPELAMARPHRLQRNTGYDKRQIVAWIDQALLMTYLPLAWQTLETEGITGAIDLVWYYSVYQQTLPAHARTGQAEDFPVGFIAAPPEVVNLAKRNKLDADSLWEAIQRMHSDQQVQMTWALYQLDGRETEA